jgi:predicted transcriptional regulator
MTKKNIYFVNDMLRPSDQVDTYQNLEEQDTYQNLEEQDNNSYYYFLPHDA